MPVIEAQSLSKRFLLKHNASVELKVRFLGLLHPGKRQSVEEFWALRRVSLRIERGEAVGLVGRNGSGKTTFMRILTGEVEPDGGEVRFAQGLKIALLPQEVPHDLTGPTVRGSSARPWAGSGREALQSLPPRPDLREQRAH